MEGLQEFVRLFFKDTKSASSLLLEIPFNLEGGGFFASLSSSDQSWILVPKPPRNVVSIMTCSKLCAVCFAVGILVRVHAEVTAPKLGFKASP